MKVLLVCAALFVATPLVVAQAHTSENVLFTCVGELIKYQGSHDGKTYYSIKETWITEDNSYPMDCYVDEGKVLR